MWRDLLTATGRERIAVRILYGSCPEPVRGGAAVASLPRVFKPGSIGGTMNQAGLVKAIAAETRLTQTHVKAVLAALPDVIARALIAGEAVAVTNFCTWMRRDESERRARNPQTGETVVIPGRPRVHVRVARRMQEVVHARDPKATTRKRNSGRHARAEAPGDR